MWFENLGPAVVGILFLAVFCEGSIEFFYAEVIKLLGELTLKEFLKKFSARYVALLLGLLLAFGFEINIPGLLGLAAVQAWVGIAVTGVVIGRGANYIHDVLSTILSMLKRAAS